MSAKLEESKENFRDIVFALAWYEKAVAEFGDCTIIPDRKPTDWDEWASKEVEAIKNVEALVPFVEDVDYRCEQMHTAKSFADFMGKQRAAGKSLSAKPA